MQSFWRDDHTIRLSILGVMLTLLYLTILIPLGFLEGARWAASDTYVKIRLRLAGPPAAASEILLVSVDDESQRKLDQKWPWDRTVFADFLEKVSPMQPKAVLFDFAFLGSGNPESDSALAGAIAKGPPTVIACYLDPNGELMLPNPLFTRAGGIPALINKPLDRDHVIRRTWAAIHYPGHAEPLYGMEVTASALYRDIPLDKISRGQAVLTIGQLAVPVGRLHEMPINFLASTQSFAMVPFWRMLRGSVDPGFVKDKIVLVGPNREITHDIHPTPLGRMAGMVIGANGIITINTQRFVKEVPIPLLLALGMLFCVAILQLTYRLPMPAGMAAALLLTGAAVLTGFWLCCRDYNVEFVSPAVLGAAAWLGGFLYKHLLLVASTLRLQRRAITDDLTGTYTARYFKLRLQEEFENKDVINVFGPLAMRSRRPVSVVLAQMAPAAQLLQDQTWEEVRGQVQSLAQALRRSVRGADVVGHIQENRFGLLLPGTGLQKATAIAERLRKAVKLPAGSCLFSLASTEQSPLASGEELLRCAEAAMARTRSNGSHGLGVYDPAVDRISREEEATSASSGRSRGANLDYVASELEERNQALEKALAEARKLHKQLESAFIEVTKSLVLALETKDAYTAGHLERVSRYSTRLAEALNLPREEVEAVREAALLHDIGKIGLPDEVLHKVGGLTEAEKNVIKEHLTIGAKILEPMKFFKSITKLIYHHHEWYNGHGYPHGLAGDFIPAGAQIIAIADAFDAMTTQRSYNKPKTPQEALQEIRRGAGTQFNPAYVEKFIEVITAEGPQLAGYEAS